MLTTWRGNAEHAPARTGGRSARASAVRATRERIILLRDAKVPSTDPPTVPELEIGAPYASWAATGNSFLLASWDPAPFKFTLAGAVQPGLEAAIRNTKDVLAHMCFTRGFCSRDGLSDGTWSHTQVIGNSTIRTVGKYISALERVYLDPTAGYQNDLIAHELGHEITIVRGGDSLARDPEQREVAEGLADMFAYDFDRADATFGEDGPSGKGTAVPYRSWNTAMHGEPLRMADYRCNTDPHFDSLILSHAYYSFVQQVGPDAAGFLLYRVPALVGPGARYTSVANAFVSAATSSYPGDSRVAAAVRQAFLTDGGLTSGPSPCPTVAPRPRLLRRRSHRPPRRQPRWRCPAVVGKSPDAASSALATAGLTVGTQQGVIDDSCNNIGAVLSQTRPAAPWSRPEPR